MHYPECCNPVRWKVIIIVLFSFLGANQLVKAQAYYGLGSDGILYIFYPGGCYMCPAGTMNAGGPGNWETDILLLPNGNFLITSNGQALQFQLYNPNPVSTFSLPPYTSFSGTATGPGGQVYMLGSQGGGAVDLILFNPVTNTGVVLGAMPVDIVVNSDLFFVNGQLFATGSGTMYLVNTGNPGNSTPMNTGILPPQLPVSDGGFYIQNTNNPVTYMQFNPQNGENINICTLTGYIPDLLSLQQIPPNFPQPNQCCITDAGVILPAYFEVCINTPITVTPLNNEHFDANDVLGFMVFSNPGNPFGSMILQSPSPTFTFNPALFQTGVYYYIAAIGGNNLAGAVDLSDPCKDISNMVTILWRPYPTVQFTTSNSNVCAGNCVTLNATFTGNPPFNLSGELQVGGNPVNNFTQVFPGNSGQITVCIPPGTTPGPVMVKATSLSDNQCICN